ncbi:RHS repeat-associated core domain-containing protein [Hellea balneolensis]|uniref:RHS repeat-associated core domain-containing protein n=1 Tax=Hellea balneolensis TaxID=287478 RepID=UPI0004122EC7|nr:RHS repeat-associated core domain-containing protein [Hellea balneolensis]
MLSIVKAVAGEAAIHYHYDGEGRLISETDAVTGETIREYVWLGLTPIASFGAANDNNPEDCTDKIAALEADIADRTTRIDNNAARIVELDDLAADKQNRIDNNAARITELGALITDKQSRIDRNAARITELEALIVDKQNHIAALNPETRAERIAELEALIITHQERIEFLTTRNRELAALITAHETRITELTTRNTELAALITAHETRVTELTDRNAELASLITGHEERSVFLTERNEVLTTQRETLQAELDALLAMGCNDPAGGSNVTFLHSDHLGRPKFATNANGEVVWDEGITTPFGIQITAMAAQTQALMFPGQYQDLETTGAGVTLSHNWHRTYDPTLGRYLQSDPIGLAGGLNRYAYVGGNPLSYIDSEGLTDRKWPQGKLIIEPGGQIDGWARDTKNPFTGLQEIQCGCGNELPPNGKDVDFIFMPSDSTNQYGASTNIIKFFGTMRVSASGRRNSGFLPWLGNKTGLRRSNYQESNYDYIVALGSNNPDCQKLFSKFPIAVQLRGALGPADIRRGNGYTE